MTSRVHAAHQTPAVGAAETHAHTLSRARALWRIGRTVALVVAIEWIVCAVSALPALYLCMRAAGAAAGNPVIQLIVVAAALAPAYGVFALSLMIVTPTATHLLGWRTPEAARMPIADLEPPLLRWACYMAAIHVVRVFAGSLLRGSPVWSMYLRLHGARLGRGVYVNSLSISDYNLLEFGDEVVIGGEAHLSGHTVERGCVITARTILGPQVTIGAGSVVDIGVRVGRGTQIGALSFVPKYADLPAGRVYAGSPVREIHS